MKKHAQIPAAVRAFGRAIGVEEIPVAIEVRDWRSLTEQELQKLQEQVSWDVDTAEYLRVTTIAVWLENRAVAGEIVAEGPPDEYKTYHSISARRHIAGESGWLPVPVEGAAVYRGEHPSDSRYVRENRYVTCDVCSRPAVTGNDTGAARCRDHAGGK